MGDVDGNVAARQWCEDQLQTMRQEGADAGFPCMPSLRSIEWTAIIAGAGVVGNGGLPEDDARLKRIAASDDPAALFRLLRVAHDCATAAAVPDFSLVYRLLTMAAVFVESCSAEQLKTVVGIAPMGVASNSPSGGRAVTTWFA